jgi:glutaredoxin
MGGKEKAMSSPRAATLYRMVTDTHVCPYGLKSRDLLQRQGFVVEDRWLTSREETDAFKALHGVETTPQTFIDGARIGGYTGTAQLLRQAFARSQGRQLSPGDRAVRDDGADGAGHQHRGGRDCGAADGAELFIAFSMCVLALLKLQDVEKFSTMFLGYDLLARRWVPYSYVYPFAEGLAGVLMIAGVLTWFAAPLALVIGGIGAVSVFKAVYIDRRELKCACVGGNSNVPLGFVSLTENLMMVAMAIWMLARH